jgi:hypothetical protein
MSRTILAYGRTVLLTLLLSSCGGFAVTDNAAGDTMAKPWQIAKILQTITEFEESGGRVSFGANIGNDDMKATYPPSAAVVSTQIVGTSRPTHSVERWIVTIESVRKAFLIELGSHPKGHLRWPDFVSVAYESMPKAEETLITSGDPAISTRILQADAKSAFLLYLTPNYSFSKEFGVVMPKAFAYSPDGAWGVGTSGVSEIARSFAKSRCESKKHEKQQRCVLVSIDGKWTR